MLNHLVDISIMTPPAEFIHIEKNILQKQRLWYIL